MFLQFLCHLIKFSCPTFYFRCHSKKNALSLGRFIHSILETITFSEVSLASTQGALAGEGCMSSAGCFDTFQSLLECCIPNFLVANNHALILARGPRGKSIDGYSQWRLYQICCFEVSSCTPLFCSSFRRNVPFFYLRLESG